MRRFIVTMALASVFIAGPIGPAITNPTPTPQQQSAVMVEWMIANCGGDGVPAILALMAPSVIGGSDPAVIDQMRGEMRDAVKARFGENADAACADLNAHIAAP